MTWWGRILWGRCEQQTGVGGACTSPDSNQNNGVFVLGVSAVRLWALKQLKPFFTCMVKCVTASFFQTPVCDGGLPGEVLPLHEDRSGRSPQQHRLSPQRRRVTWDQDPDGPGAIPVPYQLSVWHSQTVLQALNVTVGHRSATERRSLTYFFHEVDRMHSWSMRHV